VHVRLEFIDDHSISPEEVVESARALYGDSISVKISADSDDSFNLLYHAIQQHITMRQVHSYFDDGILYDSKVKQLAAEVQKLTEEAFNQVVMDNEDKLT
jgi:RNA:NAD 2'-phosphotransferase (TPT1/KptA family)